MTKRAPHELGYRGILIQSRTAVFLRFSIRKTFSTFIQSCNLVTTTGSKLFKTTGLDAVWRSFSYEQLK